MNRFLFKFCATLVALLILNVGDVMASVKAEDFFTGDYLLFAKAIDHEDIQVMRDVAKRIDLNKRVGEKEMTAFVYAVANKRLLAMSELVKLGADPALIVSSVGAPLSLAASSDDPRLLEVLLKAGCNPDTKIDDEPLLFDAQLQDRMEIVEILLNNGANINATDSVGNTALAKALNTYHYDMALYLIKKGADVHAKNNAGLSVAYSVQWEINNIKKGSAAEKKLLNIREIMAGKGVEFPAAPPPKVR